jgi:hypothetical protein
MINLENVINLNFKLIKKYVFNLTDENLIIECKLANLKN